MSKLVFGVGVNDLGYATRVYEYVTENGGKRIRKPVFICKYYEVWKNMLRRCYSKKSLESYPSYNGTSVCSEWLSATVLENGWSNKTGMGSAWTKISFRQKANSIPMTHVLLC